MEAVMAKRYLHERHLEERELDIEQGGKKVIFKFSMTC